MRGGNCKAPVGGYALPHPFPDGRVWAAIKDGQVVNMAYMDRGPAGLPFHVYRQRTRATLAKDGVVWTGRVRAGKFIPDFETNDIRHAGEMNTARCVCP